MSDGYKLNATPIASQVGIGLDSPGPYQINRTDIGSKFSTYDDYQSLQPKVACQIYTIFQTTTAIG